MEDNAEVCVPVFTNITRVESDQTNDLYQFFRNNSPIPNNFVTIFDEDDHSHLIPAVEKQESNLGSSSFDGKEPLSKDSNTNVDCLESSEVTNDVDSMEDNANITRVGSEQTSDLYNFFRNNSPIPNNFVTIFDEDDHSHLIPDVEKQEINLGSSSFDGTEPLSKDSNTIVDCLESSEVTNDVDSMEDNANITRVGSEQTSDLYNFFRNNSPIPNNFVIIFDEDDYSHLIPDVKTQESNVVSSSFDGKEPLSKDSNTIVDCLESSEVTNDVDSMENNAQVFLSNITRVESAQTNDLYQFFRNNSPIPNNFVTIFDEDDHSHLIPDVEKQESNLGSSSFDGKEPLSKDSNTNVDCLEISEVTNDVDSMEDNAQVFLSNITRVGSEQTSDIYDFFRNNSPIPNNFVIIFDEDDYTHLIPDVEMQESTFKDEKMKNSDNSDPNNTSTSMDITSSTSEIIENKNKPVLLIYLPVDESKINNISVKDVGTDVTLSSVSEITKTKLAEKKVNKQKTPKKIKNDHLHFWDSKLMSSARTREYEGRKFCNGYYNNEHRKKSQYEKRNKGLQERLAVLYSKSCEENILIKSNESIVEYENTNHSEALSDVHHNLEIRDSLVDYTKQKNFQDKKASNQNKLEINKIPNLKCTQNSTKTMPVSIKMSLINMGDNSIKQLNKPTAISDNLNCKSIPDTLQRPYSGASSSVVAQINISSAQNNANPVAKRPSHKRGISILTPEKINRKYGGAVEDDQNCETTFQPTWEAVWIECTNIPNLGWISGLRNLDNFFSFKIPGCGLSKFYPEKECYNKINIEICTRLRSLNYIAWAIRDTIDQVQGNEINTDHLNPSYILTKNGLVHARQYIFNKYEKNQPKKNQSKKNQPKKNQPKKSKKEKKGTPA